MINRIRVIIAVIIIAAFSFSCRNDSHEGLFPELGICDTTDVSYNNDIVPVMTNNCYSCHSAGSNTSGILLDDYQALSSLIEDGRILGAIQHQEGYLPMPLNADKLDECSIDKFQAWINQGADNN